jgi:hypothetical protein
MFIPYTEVDKNARIWIYQSDRKLNSEELDDIKIQLTELCEKWNAHGDPLACSFQLYDWFICLFVDESKFIASGCSIDSSVAVIKSIANQYNIDFFNRLNIAFFEGEETKVLPLNDFKRCVSSEMIVYNNLVKTKGEFEENWKASIKDTWLSKYLEN